MRYVWLHIGESIMLFPIFQRTLHQCRQCFGRLHGRRHHQPPVCKGPGRDGETRSGQDNVTELGIKHSCRKQLEQDYYFLCCIVSVQDDQPGSRVRRGGPLQHSTNHRDYTAVMSPLPLHSNLEAQRAWRGKLDHMSSCLH